MQGEAQLRASIHRHRFTFTLQPQLRLGLVAECLQTRQVIGRQRRHVAYQQRFGRAAEQLDVADGLGLAQRTQHGRQMPQNRLQRLYQHSAVVDGDDVLAGLGTEPYLQLTRFDIPAHRHARPPPIAEFRPAQWRRPFLRLHTGNPLQLFGQGTLLER
ncbi:hypothetical protein D3C79_819510 [compost metagenome]